MGLEAGLFQKDLKKLSASFLHPIFGGDKDPVQKIISTAAKHGFHLLLRQIHIRNGVNFFSLFMQPTDSPEQLRVGNHPLLFRSAFRLGIHSGQRCSGINFCQRDLTLFGSTGLLFSRDPSLGKTGRRRSEFLHPTKQISGTGHIPQQQSSEHIKADRATAGSAAAQIVLELLHDPFSFGAKSAPAGFTIWEWADDNRCRKESPSR